MVRASAPVASLIRLAARPVGAHRTVSLSFESSSRMQLMMVVLPVPGPPVITKTPFSSAPAMAWRWVGEKVMFRCFSKDEIARETPAYLSGAMAVIRRRIMRATSCSAYR